jgi:hypothetical protein
MSQTIFITNQYGNGFLKKNEGVFEDKASFQEFDKLVGDFQNNLKNRSVSIRVHFSDGGKMICLIYKLIPIFCSK